jgi:chaperonin cofactor prefoldin
MQFTKAALAFALGATSGSAAKDESNPLGAVVTLLNDLTAKVKKDGEAEEKAYKEYFEWCDDVSGDKQNEITTATSQKNKLEASIEELGANIEAADSQIASLTGAIATNTADLKAATFIREKESSDFIASEKELADAVDTLSRAVSILEREMQKNPAALAQMNTGSLAGLLQSIGAVVDAAAFGAADKQKLLALVQSHADEDDGELGAPAAATYKSHSTGIFDVLEDLKEKAENELSELRKAEKTSDHNYKMLKQSLVDQLAADNNDLSGQQSRKAADEESKAVAEGDLSVTNEELKNSQKGLKDTSSHCMTVAADHEAAVNARNNELKVLAQATKILEETTSGAVGQTYSFIQLHTSADLAKSEVLALIKKLARTHHSAALAQLASRVSVVMRYGAGSADPFSKIKGLIRDMITKLESEAQSEATEKAYCDEEIAKTLAKKAELDAEIEGLTTKIDQAAAQSASLKKEVAQLQADLAKLAEEQASREQWRQDENNVYTVAKADLELGLGGVRKALEALRTYYNGGAAAALLEQPAQPAGHDAATGAGQSIIGILEVVESDFADNLSKVETEEADAVAVYEASTQENKITVAEKSQDVKYKTAEFTTLDKHIAEHSSDRDTANTELAAVTEYYGKLKDRCIAKPETYEERSGRRQAEIAGLKEALDVLNNEAALVQRSGKHGRHMRGAIMA